MEQLDLTDMLPTKFQPVASRQFIFTLPLLDAFLVKRVERAPYVRPDQSWKKTDRERLEESLAHQRLIVYLHDTVAPSVHLQIMDLINSQKSHQAHIKLLDPVGTIIGGTTFNYVQVERVDYSPMDYDSSGMGEVKLTLSYNNEEPYRPQSLNSLPIKAPRRSKCSSTVGVCESGVCIKQQAAARATMSQGS